MNQDQINAYNQEQADTAKEQAFIDLQKTNTDTIVKTVATSGVALAKIFQQSIDKLIQFEKTNTVVTVSNQNEPIDTVNTPDIKYVVDALKELQATITNKKTDNSGMITAINELNNSIKSFIVEIPEPVEEVIVKNQVDYSKQLKDIKQSVDKIELKPVINIPDAKNDYSSIIDELSKVILAVKEITFPDTPLDLTPLIQSTNEVQKAITSIKFPIPNYVLPFKDQTGKATQAVVDYSGSTGVNLKQSNTILFAKIDVATAGDTTIVPQSSTYKIKLLSCKLIANGAVQVKWRSGTTDLEGANSLTQNSGYVLPASSPGQGHYLETAAGAALNINLSGAVQTSGHITYYLEV